MALALPTAGRTQDTVPAESFALGTIVVTASGFEQTVADAPASVSVITRDDLETGAFRDLGYALKEVQGVATTGVANEQDIQIRGLPGSYTLILVDGRRQGTRESRPNGSAGSEQSFIPPVSAIERIEVVRGPMSSLYGSDAMGGVINIITRDADSVWRGSVTLDSTLQGDDAYGDTQQAAFYLSGPLVQDRLSLQVWGRALRRAEDTATGGIDGARDGSLAARLTYALTSDQELYLEAGRTRLQSLQSPGLTLAEGDAESRRDNDRDHVALGHAATFGRVTTDISLQIEEGRRTTFGRDADTGALVADDRVPEIRNTVLDGKMTVPFTLRGTHTLVTGFQFNRATLTDQGHLPIDQTLRVDQFAVFAEDEWQVTDSLALTGGLRVDEHETYGTHLSPRLYAVWQPTDGLTVKGGVSTGFKAPGLRQVAPDYYMPTQRGAGLIAANPDLRPEQSTSYELGMIWDNRSDLVVSATAFQTEFRDKISNMNTGQLVDPVTGAITDPLGDAACDATALSDYPGTSCLWQSFNIDDAVVRGLELAATWEATPDLRIRGSYTYTDSEQRSGDFAGFPLQRTPRDRVSLRGDWDTPADGVAVWAAATYHGKELNSGARIGDAGTPVTIDGQEGRSYDPYTLVDLGASWDVSESVSLNGAVYNAFDAAVTQDDSNTVIEGRRLWVSLTTRF
ncbi:TonB-dependent receptor domain-containing protein [Loktanella fryxellensis]|nr:TonB-dependent receptor [Loktanella fryxellensis]